jgi:hypothetical protein
MTTTGYSETFHGQNSTHRYLMECTDKCLLVPVALDSGLKDRIAVLRVLERDALYGTLDLLHDG